MKSWRKKRTKEEEYERKKNHYHDLSKRLMYTTIGILGLSCVFYCLPFYMGEVLAKLCIPLALIIYAVSLQFLDNDYTYVVCPYCLRYIKREDAYYGTSFTFKRSDYFCAGHAHLFWDELEKEEEESREKNDER
ncbi:MAG: hypothetical protein [Bacteriophage sp.]|nr:MAG: hypothetical protein [Bacteriophage sp.]